MRVLKCFDCDRSDIELRLEARNGVGRMVCGCRERAIRIRAKAKMARTPYSFQTDRLRFTVREMSREMAVTID